MGCLHRDPIPPCNAADRERHVEDGERRWAALFPRPVSDDARNVLFVHLTMTIWVFTNLPRKTECNIEITTQQEDPAAGRDQS